MAGDKCTELAEEIHKEIHEIREELEKLDPNNPQSLVKFKPQYDKLLEVLEKSKNLATCPIPVLKVNDECVYKSPLEPLLLFEYAGIPHPDEPYTIIDDIRRHGKNGRLDKILQLVSDVDERLESYVRGVKECPIDFGEESPEDIDSMMLELGLNPEEFLEESEEEEESSD